MNHPPAPPAWRVQRYASLASTQDTAIAAAKAGDPGRLAIIADAQTNGRGSRGRAWVAPAGNLNFSALLRPVEQRGPGFWSFLAGIALHDALSPYAAGLMLKWPNDLLLNGAKLGGILIDAAEDFLVIGIGANLASAPQIEGRCTAHLSADPIAVAESLMAAIDHYETRPAAEINEAWLQRAHPLGTELDIRTPDRSLKGPFAGLTPTGALCIAGHSEPLSSAEVFLA